MDPANKVTENICLFGNLQTVVTEHLYFTSCFASSEVARKSVTKTQALRGCPGECMWLFPLPQLPSLRPQRLRRMKAGRVSVIPIHSWALWNLNLILLHCHLNAKSWMSKYSSRQRHQHDIWKSLFHTFWKLWKKILLLLQKYCFHVLVEIHNGDIIFNHYHKQKYLVLMEIILDMTIMENII